MELARDPGPLLGGNTPRLRLVLTFESLRLLLELVHVRAPRIDAVAEQPCSGEEHDPPGDIAGANLWRY